MYCNKTSLWCTFGKMEYHSEQGDWSLVTSLVDTGDIRDWGVWGRVRDGHLFHPQSPCACRGSTHVQLLSHNYWSLWPAASESSLPSLEHSLVQSLSTLSIPFPRKKASLLFNTARISPTKNLKILQCQKKIENRKKPSEKLHYLWL